MNESADLSSHILVVAVIAFYWALLGNWGQLLLPRDDDSAKPKDAPPAQRTGGVTSSLVAIREIDKQFDDAVFLAGAKSVFETVLRAYADGDIEIVRPFLGPDVFETFERAIAERRDRKETLQLTFIGIRQAGIIGAESERDATEITVRFVSEVISTTRTAKDEIVAGDPEQIVEVRDLWTFTRPVVSKHPNWRLIATDVG